MYRGKTDRAHVNPKAAITFAQPWRWQTTTNDEAHRTVSMAYGGALFMRGDDPMAVQRPATMSRAEVDPDSEMPSRCILL